MSLGRELKEFSSAFGSSLNTMNSFGAMADRRDRRKARDAADPNKSPEVQDAAKKYYQDYGTKPPETPATSFPADYEDQPTLGYREGGLVRDTPEEAERAYAESGQTAGPRGKVTEELAGTSGETPQYRTRNKGRALELDDMTRRSTIGTSIGPRWSYRKGGLVMDTPGYIRARQTAIGYADETPDLPHREYDPDGQQVVDGQTPLGPRSDESWNEPPVPQPPMNAGEDAPSGATGRGDPAFSAPYTQPGASNDVMPNRQAPRKDAIPPAKAQAIPASPAAASSSGRTGTGTGTGGARPAATPPKRKALDDQTRTEAYDPELDGPTEAIPASPVVVTPAGDPAKGDATHPDYRMTGAAGEGTSPSATADYTTALDGGIKFATNIFNLNGSGAAIPGTDRSAAAGRQAFAKGTGAATPDMVRAIDRHVNQIPGVPNDEAIWGIRRLEAVYRFYSRRGETDKANKAVFELMQYSAGMAAKYGDAALAQLKANDQSGAVQTSVNGFNQIPNGQRATVNGKEVSITDARTGQVVQRIPITPQAIFNVALGLSDRSLYWEQLMSRAAATMKGRSTRTEAQEELTRAQIELTKKRTANVGVKSGGGGGMSPAAQQIIDGIGKLDTHYGRAPAAAPSAAAPPPAAGSTDGDAGLDPEDPDRGVVTDGTPMPLGGARPANADGQGGGESGGLTADEDAYMKRRASILEQTQPKPSLRITPQRPSQAIPTSTKPEPGPATAKTWDGYPVRQNADGTQSSELSITVTDPKLNEGRPTNIPSMWGGKEVDQNTAITNALKSGKQWPSFKSIDEAVAAASARSEAKGRGENAGPPTQQQPDPDTVPDIEVVRDGARYRPTPRGNEPRPFDREKPDPNYLRELQKAELAAAQLPPKERPGVQQAIRSRIATYNAEVKQWERDMKAHTTNEQRRVKDEHTASIAELKAKAKEAYDYKPRPPERAKLIEDIGVATQKAVETITTKGGKVDDTIFGTIDDGQIKNLALEIMTSNPLPDANRAVQIIAKMTRWDDEDAARRFYKPQGRDILGNVVVHVDDIGFVHLRPEAYKDLTKIARDRVTAAVAKREKAGKPGEPSKLQQGRKAVGDAVQRSWLGRTLPGDKDYDATVKLIDEADRQKKNIQQRNKDNPAPNTNPSPFTRGKAIPTSPRDDTNKSPFSR